MQTSRIRKARSAQTRRVGSVAATRYPVPKTMRAIAVERYGGPDVLTLEELPVPELGPKEVLIAVHTAGVGGGKRTFAKDGILVDAFVFPWSSGRMARAQLLSWVRGYAASKWATRFIPTVGIIPRVDFMRSTLWCPPSWSHRFRSHRWTSNTQARCLPLA